MKSKPQEIKSLFKSDQTTHNGSSYTKQTRSKLFSFLIPSITQSPFKQHENKFQSLSTVNDVACLRASSDVVPFLCRLSFTKNFHFAWHGKIKLSLSVSIRNTRHIYHFPIHFSLFKKVLRHHAKKIILQFWKCGQVYLFKINSYMKDVSLRKGQIVIWELTSCHVIN